VVSASAPIVYNSGTKALSLTMGSGSGLSADTLRGLTDQQFVRRYSVEPGSSAGRKYLRLFTIDGVNSTGGGGGTLWLSGTGASGSAEKATHLIQVGQRNTAFSLKVWSWNRTATSLPVEFYSKQISTYVYEVWAYTADYTKTHDLVPMVRNNLTVNMDSVSTTAPTGLSTAVTPVNMDAGGPAGPTGPAGPQGNPGIVLLTEGSAVPPGTPSGTLVAFWTP
jgi:hypothetical protein